MHSTTVLQDALNRLGGGQAGPPASADLRASTPVHLPLVIATADLRTRRVDLRAVNVATLMAEWDGDEAAVVEALAVVLAGGAFDAAGGDPSTIESWSTADPRGVARQLAQWALDHRELRLELAVFEALRPLLP